MGIVVVTGAARGIGRACAQALADLGPLLLVDLREALLAETAAALRAEGATLETLACDLTDPDAIADLVARVGGGGGLRALAHAAGLSGSMASAERVLEVNLQASARLVDALEPHLQPGSAAVLLASQAGHFTQRALDAQAEALLADPLQPDLYQRLVEALGAAATGSQGAYGLSKRGVQLLAISRAPAWGRRGARILSLSPGIIETDMGHAEAAANDELVKRLIESTPIGARMGRPEEIAAVVAFACSDAASFLSGVDLLVDGGSTHQFAT